MITRLALVAALIAFPSAAHAGDISGWWTIGGTSEAAATEGKAGGYFSYAPPPETTTQQGATPLLGPSSRGPLSKVCQYQSDGAPTESSRANGCSQLPYRSERGALSRSEPRVETSAPGTCGFSGQLAVRESKPGAAKGECALSLIYSCGDSGRHMSVVQACTMTRKGNAITIRGANAEISEAVPPRAWPTSYSPDTLQLTLSSDSKSMTGKLAGKPKSSVKLTKFLDIVE